MYKVILLDVDNTLLDFDKCAEVSIIDACKELSIPYEDRFAAAFNRINVALWEKVERGTLSVEELHKIRWATIFEDLCISQDGVLFESVFRKYLKVSAVPVDGAIDLLRYLKGKYFLAVASNASFNQQKTRLDNAGMTEYFDKLFMSEALGYYKPDPRFFEASLKEIPSFRKEEVLFIGDSLSADVAGGVAAGIDTCWFNKYGAKSQSLNSKYTVTALKEIKNII